MKPNEFPGELSYHRGRNGLTQKQLADRLKVSVRSVKLWEAGESMPRKGLRIQMAQVLGLSPAYFLQEEEIPNSVTKQEATLAERQLQQLQNKFVEYLADMELNDAQKQYLSNAVNSAIEKINMT